MCAKSNVSSAITALLSLMLLLSAGFAEIARADEAPLPNTEASKPKFPIAKKSPWSTMIYRSRPTKALNRNDQRAALEAIHFALREVADGAIFVWRRQKSTLNGQVKPTSSFRDAKGAVCRHIEFSISHGTNTRQIESIACRKNDGSWTLSG